MKAIKFTYILFVGKDLLIRANINSSDDLFLRVKAAENLTVMQPGIESDWEKRRGEVVTKNIRECTTMYKCFEQGLLSEYLTKRIFSLWRGPGTTGPKSIMYYVTLYKIFWYWWSKISRDPFTASPALRLKKSVKFLKLITKFLQKWELWSLHLLQVTPKQSRMTKTATQLRGTRFVSCPVVWSKTQEKQTLSHMKMTFSWMALV